MHIPGSSHPQYQGLACHTNSRHVLLCNLSMYCLPPCLTTIPIWDDVCLCWVHFSHGASLVIEYILHIIPETALWGHIQTGNKHSLTNLDFHQDDHVRDFLYLKYLLYLLHSSSIFDVSYCIINRVISYWPSAELALTFSLRPSTMTYSYVNGPIRNIVLKRLSFGSKECTNELKLECANFLGQTS